MCGRIAQAYTPEELAELLGITRGLDRLSGLHPSYNVPPTAHLPALVSDEDAVPTWTTLQWGILPAWKRDGRAIINARSETVATKPLFRSAFQRRRCVLPVTAYYEWQRQAGSKQPYCIRDDDESPLLLAGIYERENTCAVLTRPVRADLAHIHDRMPVLLTRDLLEAYLDIPDPHAVATFFGAADLLAMRAYPVTRSMGSPRFDEPSCLSPITL